MCDTASPVGPAVLDKDLIPLCKRSANEARRTGQGDGLIFFILNLILIGSPLLPKSSPTPSQFDLLL